jgi:hypothetical protein
LVQAAHNFLSRTPQWRSAFAGRRRFASNRRQQGGAAMKDEPPNKALEAEFDCLMARGSLTIPAARKAGYLTAFADLRSQLALLRTDRTAAAEPSNVFHLSPMEPRR